jgi:hypothetical protein
MVQAGGVFVGLGPVTPGPQPLPSVFLSPANDVTFARLGFAVAALVRCAVSDPAAMPASCA